MASISLKYKSKQGNLTAPGDVDPGAMIPIATVNGTGSSSTLTFSSIPQNYEHLQIRGIASVGDMDDVIIQFNSDTGSNYSWHMIVGNGSSVAAYSGTSTTYMKSYYKEVSDQSVIAQLQQLTHLTWDGDLLCKALRNRLVKAELAQQMPNGWNIITPKGVEYLETLGFINP